MEQAQETILRGLKATYGETQATHQDVERLLPLLELLEEERGELPDHRHSVSTGRVGGGDPGHGREADGHRGEGRISRRRIHEARLALTLARHGDHLADIRHQTAMASVTGVAQALERHAGALGPNHHQQAAGLRQIAQAIRAGHEPTLSALATRPVRAKGGAVGGGGHDHLFAASAQPGVFAMLDGSDPDAAMRFLRQWGIQAEARIKSFRF